MRYILTYQHINGKQLSIVLSFDGFTGSLTNEQLSNIGANNMRQHVGESAIFYTLINVESI